MFLCDFKGIVHPDMLHNVRLLTKICIYKCQDSFVYTCYSGNLVSGKLLWKRICPINATIFGHTQYSTVQQSSY